MKPIFKLCCLSLALLLCLHAAAQNVGIGISTPADKLHVLGGHTILENNGTNYPWLEFRNNSLSKGYIGVNNNDLRIGTWPGSNTTGHIALVTNNLDRFRVMSDGDVGIATATPRGLFDIGGGNEAIYFASNTITGNQRIAYMPGDIFMAPWAGSNISYLEARRSDNSGSTNLQLRTYNAGSARDALFISSLGKVGVNNNNPVATLEINQIGDNGILLRGPSGDLWEQKVAYDPNGFPAPTLQFYHNGVLRAQVSNSTGAWSPVSDARLKTNIDIIRPVLDDVMQLVPRKYEMIHNNPGNEQSIGFIAQEVKAIFPLAVQEASVVSLGKQTKLLTVDYNSLNVIAIKAIQEQQEEIEKLKKELAEIKKLLTQPK